jgi:hypothetical protein
MIVYRHGKSFPFGGVVIGWLFFIVGLVMLLGNSFLGLPVLIIGSVMAFTKSLTIIDVANEKIRTGASFLGVKFGDWEDYSSFPYISVLRNDVKTKMLSRGSAEAHLKDVYYNINLLSGSHRKKILILKYPEKGKAIAEAKKVAIKIERELVDFNPVLSQRTKERRDRRR